MPVNIPRDDNDDNDDEKWDSSGRSICGGANPYPVGARAAAVTATRNSE
jgi:hypothetical protein